MYSSSTYPSLLREVPSAAVVEHAGGITLSYMAENSCTVSDSLQGEETVYQGACL